MADDAGERVRELVEFALEKLPSMRLEDGTFCYEVEAPGLDACGPLPSLHADLSAGPPAREGCRAWKCRSTRTSSATS